VYVSSRRGSSLMDFERVFSELENIKFPSPVPLFMRRLRHTSRASSEKKRVREVDGWMDYLRRRGSRGIETLPNAHPNAFWYYVCDAQESRARQPSLAIVMSVRCGRRRDLLAVIACKHPCGEGTRRRTSRPSSTSFLAAVRDVTTS